jgi:hypothetical protein
MFASRALVVAAMAMAAVSAQANSAAFAEAQSVLEVLTITGADSMTSKTTFNYTVLTDLGPGNHYGGADGPSFDEEPRDPLYADAIADAEGSSTFSVESVSTTTFTLHNFSEFDEQISLHYGGDLRGSADVTDPVYEFASSTESFDIWDSNSNRDVLLGSSGSNTVTDPHAGNNVLVGFDPAGLSYTLHGFQTLTITFNCRAAAYATSLQAVPEPAPLAAFAGLACAPLLRKKRKSSR